MIVDRALLPDAELVRAAQAGDRVAHGTLFERHQSLAKRLCWRMLGDADLARDALQEAALQSLTNIGRLRRPDRFGAWFAGIAVHVCHRTLRSRSSDEWSLEALAGGRFALDSLTVDADLDDVVELVEVARRVRAAVAELPRGQRAAVLLVYLGGCSQSEVAELLGIRSGALKTRLHKARSRLRRELLSLWEDFMSEETSDAPTRGRLLATRVADVRRTADGRLWVILREAAGGRERWLEARKPQLANAIAVCLHAQRLPGWLCDDLVPDIAETALVREFPHKPPRSIEGALHAVRLVVRDSELVGALDLIDAGGRSAEAFDEAVHAVLRALATGVPLHAEAQVFEPFVIGSTPDPNTSADPFDAGSVGASQLVDEVRARWERWRSEGPDWVEMRVADIFRVADCDHFRHVVILKETSGTRYFTFTVGEREGAGIAVLLAGIETPRPFSIVLTGQLLSAAGAHVRQVRIHRLFDQTYYAEIVLVGANGEQTIDARPSDAVAVAVHMGAPVYVAAHLLEVSADYDIKLPDPSVATRISEAVLATWHRGQRLEAATS